MRLSVVLVLLSYLANFSLAEDPDCTITDTTNRRFYDLRPLMRLGGQDYTAKDEATGNVYKLNVCNPVHTKVEGISSSTTGIFRQTDNTVASLGQYTTRPYVSHDVLSLRYLDGSTCPQRTSLSMSTVIAFVCDHGVYGQGQPEFVASLSDCNFFFVWKTQYACSTTSAGIGSGLGIFVTAILILIGVYMGGFFLYNRFVLKRRGAEQFPSFGPTIIEAWSFVKDMVIIIGASIWDKVAALTGRSNSRRGFEGLPPDH